MCRDTSQTFDQAVSFFYTPDLQASARFWEETIGLPLVLDQGPCRIYRVSQDGFIGFCQREGTQASPDVIITLVAQDVDERCNTLKERGVVFEKDPVHNPTFNIYHAFLRDPAGYLVEIQRFEDPSWPKPQSTRQS